MPPKRRAPARGAGKKAADATGDRDILVIEVIEGPAKGTKFTPTVRIHLTDPTSIHPHPPFPLFPLKRVHGLTSISPPSSRVTGR